MEQTLPLDVFYVVHSTGRHGERQHLVRSILYQKKLHADAELARVRADDPEGTYDVWHAATYIEPAAWAYDVLLADGTLIHPSR
jgi:RPA family protein